MPDDRVIHVVEDDQPMRDSLVELLEEAGYRTHAYENAQELLARGSAAEPGCVVSDMRMPGIDGMGLLRGLQAGGIALPLILITGHGDIAMAVNAMKAGAVDFLEKPFEPDALLGAIARALRLRSISAGEEGAAAALQRLEKLTLRELEVLRQLVAGESNKEIAEKLGISPRTVEFHRANIMEKTGAASLPELVRVWLSAAPAAPGSENALRS